MMHCIKSVFDNDTARVHTLLGLTEAFYLVGAFHDTSDTDCPMLEYDCFCLCQRKVVIYLTRKEVL